MDVFELFEVVYERVGKPYGGLVFALGVATTFGGIALGTMGMSFAWDIVGVGVVFGGFSWILRPFTWFGPVANVQWSPMEPATVSRFRDDPNPLYSIGVGVTLIVVGVAVVGFYPPTRP